LTQTALGELDSATNSMLQTAMERNLLKGLLVAEVLEKLLSFMANASSLVECHEQNIAARFSGSSSIVTAASNALSAVSSAAAIAAGIETGIID